MERQAGVFQCFIGDFHRDSPLGIQSDRLRGGDVEKRGIEYVRVLLEEVSAFSRQRVYSVLVGMVEGIRISAIRLGNISIF